MIDSHHHFWKFTQPEFDWLDESLRRSFECQDLEDTLSSTGVEGVVSVKARCCVEENEYLLHQASKTNLIKGIVGWVDLKSEKVAEDLAVIADHDLIKGVREITQGQPDDKFLTNEKFNQGVSQLAAHGLKYDLLIFEDQLESANQFVARHDELPMVLDHCAKPSIRHDLFPREWEKGIRQLAQHENLFCKLSGLATEIRDESACSVELMRPYFDTVLEVFGAKRIMFGSDWPVSLGKVSYSAWLECVYQLISELSEEEKNSILSENAIQFYGL